MKKHCREWFAKTNAVCLQGVDIPDAHMDAFQSKEGPGDTEAMYQAFKARFLEETGLEIKDVDRP
jgi:hypothetical protein